MSKYNFGSSVIGDGVVLTLLLAQVRVCPMSFFQTFFGGSSVVMQGGSGRQNISVRNGVINIDGREFHGQNVVCNDEGIWIDGKLITPEGDGAPLKYRVTSINITGDAGAIEAGGADVTVSGSVIGRINTVSGDVKVDGSVGGDVQTVSGDVKTASIKGSVKTVSGDIDREFRARK